MEKVRRGKGAVVAGVCWMVAGAAEVLASAAVSSFLEVTDGCPFEGPQALCSTSTNVSSISTLSFA